MQIDPLPIPHLTPSAPASINLLAPSPVAMLPATMSTLGNYSLSYFTVSIHNLLCPFAMSTTRTSHPAFTSARALSVSFAPTAAPTNS